MVRNIMLASAGIALAIAPQAALAAGYHLSATVAVHCSVQHGFAGYGQAAGEGISLGEIREYCNAANGYELVVDYTPGSLRGTTLIAGQDSVLLDGSGRAVLSRAQGPRIRERALVATPGQAGFDAHSVQFSVIVS